MSALIGEDTITMPPVRMALIENVAEAFLAEVCPEALTRPMPVDVLHLAENVLPQEYGIHVTPAGAAEMGDNLGLTDPSGSSAIQILLREELWNQLLEGGPRANRARATVAHEFGHAVLHVPVIRRRRASARSKHLLARVARQDIPAYMDAEWQAWALGGCILAPRRTIMMVPDPSVTELANIYEVSSEMMRFHLRRLKLNVPQW